MVLKKLAKIGGYVPLIKTWPQFFFILIRDITVIVGDQESLHQCTQEEHLKWGLLV